MLVARVDVGPRSTHDLGIPHAPRRRITAVAVGAIVLYGFVVLGGIVEAPARTIIDDVGGSLGALVAAGLALLAARAQPERRVRASWLLLGAGLLIWGLTDAYWTWSELVL